ncbi:MAG: DUF3299 domain-containing protein [Lentisphaeraceae bacterium]|nr:DUF3299 domain-containing protein [Lentisphaeraceae bacterium]
MRLFISLIIFVNVVLLGQETDKEPVTKVAFKTLISYDLPLEVSQFAEEDQIPDLKKAVPEKVKLLDGKKVKIKGFMVPVTYDKDNKVTAFLFAPDRTSCCYGKIPNLNGFIFSRSSDGVKYLKDTLIEVTGTLQTIPRFYKEEECVLIYKMKVDSVKTLEIKGSKGFKF